LIDEEADSDGNFDRFQTRWRWILTYHAKDAAFWWLSVTGLLPF